MSYLFRDGVSSLLKTKRWRVAALCGLMAACLPAFADVHYVTRLHWNGDAIFEGWVSGTNGRFEVKNSYDPSFPEGSVIFTRDGGNVAYLYSPQSSECVKTTPDQLVTFKRDQINHMHITADGLKVERLADEDAPPMFGYRTHHYRLRISVTMHVPSGPSDQDYVVMVEEDYWTAPDVHEQAPNLASFTNGSTGIALLDDAITAELAKAEGFPLKRLVAATSILGGQSSDMGQTAVTVTDFGVVAVDKTLFDLPKSCEDAQ
jgi:hypothetical protein